VPPLIQNPRTIGFDLKKNLESKNHWFWFFKIQNQRTAGFDSLKKLKESTVCMKELTKKNRFFDFLGENQGYIPKLII